MKCAFVCKSQRGLTLVELMIAMLLGLFLVGGLLQLFISSKQTYRMQEAISRLQENGRFAIDFMTRDIRLAGYKGCASRTYVPMSVLKQSPGTSYTPSTTDFTYNFNTPIQGFEAISTSAWSPAMVPDITSPLVGGSDVITIRRADEQGFLLAANQADNNADLTLDSTTTTRNNLKEAGFFTTATTPANKCAIAVVADCVDAVVFQVSAISSANALAHNTGPCSSGAIPPGNQQQDLGKAYKTDAQVRLMNTISYYVKKDNDQSSLFRRIGANDAQELVGGVESMQILYGVDTEPDESANYYVAANAVPDWNKVVSVRISLLLATIDNNLTDQPAASFSFNTVYNTPADRRIRRVFTSTIAVRNHRLPS